MTFITESYCQISNQIYRGNFVNVNISQTKKLIKFKMHKIRLPTSYNIYSYNIFYPYILSIGILMALNFQSSKNMKVTFNSINLLKNK